MSIQLMRTPEGLGIMLINDPSGHGCIIKTVMETSMASGTLLPNDRSVSLFHFVTFNVISYILSFHTVCDRVINQNQIKI